MDHSQNEFLTEISQLIEQIFTDLDELRRSQGDSRVHRQLIDQIFRRVHSVKGSSASSDLHSVSQIAHQFENLLDSLRDGSLSLDEDVLDLCEATSNAMAESVARVAAGINEPDQLILFEKLQAAVASGAGKSAGSGGSTDESVLNRIPAEILAALDASEKHHLAATAGEGAQLFEVQARFESADFDAQFSSLKEKLATHGEIISTSPAIDDNQPETISFRILYASHAGNNPVSSVAEFADVKFRSVELGSESESPANSERLLPTAPSFTSRSNSVRIDLDKLDRVISSTHELFRKTLSTFELAITPASANVGEDLSTLKQRIGNSFKVLEADLINLRMVSLGPALQRAARAGRAAARLAAKEIEFEVLGADLQIDKLLADAIADPLIQLVRNAVDHGIENTDARRRAGKNARGTITIAASSNGGQSRVRITDDGRGLDPVLVSSAAKRLGIVNADSAPDLEQSLRLIFRPGFTTLESMSEVSGRGVGLDVVETAVEQVGGELRVSSAHQRGTTFEILLPITFSVIAATVFTSAGARYCVPANQVVSVEPVDVNSAQENTYLTFQGARLRVYSIRELLGQPAAGSEATSLRAEPRLMIFQASSEEAELSSGEAGIAAKRIALLVDSLEGTEEILVRNLGRYAGRWHGVSGATELSDGSVALVLDPSRLLGTTV